jgi:hypothetical protein
LFASSVAVLRNRFASVLSNGCFLHWNLEVAVGLNLLFFVLEDVTHLVFGVFLLIEHLFVGLSKTSS